MKLSRLFAMCCACAWLAAGLVYGQTMPRHRYYGRSPVLSPPYWEVPDLTEPYVNPPRSELDITNKVQQKAGHEDMLRRRPEYLQGRELGRRWNFFHPRTYSDHSVLLRQQNWFRYRSSTDFLQQGPTISSTAPRYNVSLRYWQIVRYRSPMQEYMDQRQRLQPR